ncbi:MAG: hypothetical protein CM15mP106_6330 [Candidatus Neomarinimicrobiota bacterium]|nr:MAG: hypothetical protein CM15mP106_6330 [Candidatus Neomarinimicrobiota bacterium]
MHKEFFNNGNIKIDGQYSYGIKVDFGTEYFREGGTMRRFYSNENGKDGSLVNGIKWWEKVVVNILKGRKMAMDCMAS